MKVMNTGTELLLTRTAVIRWDDGDEKLATFALIPQNWVARELSAHPFDESVFYWLDAYEWISFGVGYGQDGWHVIE
jgi:hypothetical protein